MYKTRKSAPPPPTDGKWFQHRGLSDPGPLLRETSTTTGLMLTSPYKQQTNKQPPTPPKGFKQRDVGNYKKSNNFSLYDNRHSFQDHGVYFGDGRRTRTLGKSIVPPSRRQHWTDRDFLTHLQGADNSKNNSNSNNNGQYNTVYTTEYRGLPTDEVPLRRRFPKVYKEPDKSRTNPDTSTTDWIQSQDVIQKTPTEVLALCQEPFLSPNKWKYSYHGPVRLLSQV